MTLKLTRLINADNEVVGYFSDHVAEMAARKEWDVASHAKAQWKVGYSAGVCRSISTAIVAAELENVDAGDSDRVDYVVSSEVESAEERLEPRLWFWQCHGAACVEMQRFLVNRYRRPGMSNRDADLGGLTEASGVLYALKIKAPK